MTLNIPEGYVLVPKIWADKYFSKAGWDQIKTPTISEASNYLGVTINKIKKDLAKADCPLRKLSNGGNGRGDEMKFIKNSVENYKDWIRR